MSELSWRKSTRSNAYDNCVEVAVSQDAVAVRDSKDRAGGHIAVPPRQWHVFLDHLRNL